MEILEKFPLPWQLSKEQFISDDLIDENTPYTISIQDANKVDVFCGLYWETDKGTELIQLFEFIVKSVNKDLE